MGRPLCLGRVAVGLVLSSHGDCDQLLVLSAVILMLVVSCFVRPILSRVLSGVAVFSYCAAVGVFSSHCELVSVGNRE